MSTLFQINKRVRTAVILNLRRIFTGDPKYPYIEDISGEYDFDNTKITISAAIPQDHTFFPAIVVDTVSGSEDRYLGPEALGETKNSNYEVTTDDLFASLSLTVTIRVYTRDDAIARDEVIDRIYDNLKLITDDLADSGIEVRKSTFVSDSRQFVNDRWQLTSGLDLDIYAEWTDDLGVTDRVEKIPIDITLDLNP